MDCTTSSNKTSSILVPGFLYCQETSSLYLDMKVISNYQVFRHNSCRMSGTAAPTSMWIQTLKFHPIWPQGFPSAHYWCTRKNFYGAQWSTQWNFFYNSCIFMSSLILIVFYSIYKFKCLYFLFYVFFFCFFFLIN